MKPNGKPIAVPRYFAVNKSQMMAESALENARHRQARRTARSKRIYRLVTVPVVIGVVVWCLHQARVL